MTLRAFLAASLSALLSVAFACSGTMDGTDPDTDGGSGVDAGERDAGTIPGEDATVPDEDGGGVPGVDAGPPPSGRVPVFVAQGHAGRVVRSCDGGETWIDDTSHDDAIRCFTDGFDCDHHPGAGKGIVYGRDHFFATFGWGPPGGVFRSTDAVTWEPLLEETTFGGIAVGTESLVAAARTARRSTDDGDSWSNVETQLEGWNVRRSAWLPVPGGEGLFVIVGDGDGGPDVVVSDDGGRTWDHPSFPQGTCGNGVQTDGGIVYGNGTIVIVGGDGNACRSTDGGATFTPSRVADGVGSQAVFDGERFWVWSRGSAYRSTDGASWERVATTPNDVEPGPVAYHAALDRFVAVRGGWQTWYDRQVFWHSEDGVTWTVASSFRGGHPIRFVTEGWAPESASCSAD
jgi:hypothetical protein